MLIGYADEKVRRMCEDGRVARTRLPQDVAALLPLRLSQLAAFTCLSEVPSGTLLHRHRLAEDGAAHHAVRIYEKYRVIFKLAGHFGSLADGNPDLDTVTSIEIVSIGNQR